MSRKHSELQREWSLYCSYGSSPPPIANWPTQQEELYSSDTLSTQAQRDDMSSRPASSSSSDSLYAPPSPPTLRRVAASSQYTSFCDVPSLDLNSRRGAVDPTAYRGMPAGLVHSYPDPAPRGPLRVVNGDATTLDELCPPLFDGRSRIRLKSRPARGKIDFTDASAERNSELPRGREDLHAALSEKRKLDADIHNMTKRLETAFRVEKPQRSGGLAPTGNTAWCPEHNAHNVCSEKTTASVEQQAAEQRKEHGKKRPRAMHEEPPCQAELTRHWPSATLAKNPVHVRSSTTTFIEDVNALRQALLHSTPPQTAPEPAPPYDGATAPAGNTPNGATHAAGPTSVPRRATQTAEQESGRARPWAWLQGARRVAAVREEADQEAQWDCVELSDDEGWDKVGADEGAEWEVLDK